MKVLESEESRGAGDKGDAGEDSDVAARPFEVTAVGKIPTAQIKDKISSSKPDPAQKRRSTEKMLAGHGYTKQVAIEHSDKRLAFTIAQICMPFGESLSWPCIIRKKTTHTSRPATTRREEAPAALTELSDADKVSKQVKIDIIPDTGASGTIQPAFVPSEETPERMIPEQLKQISQNGNSIRLAPW
ncbi:hypothetical protein GN244_ATG04780 [Phytophthora infestans]|uniref:Uncharacterized protein n=1 Tax=Phytophthora infestans TaxID=4787 RepID=A0A833WJ81_PHYIN|nr:hypothetical protein GN244_ATG04780 [Phytophthora infestans]